MSDFPRFEYQTMIKEHHLDSFGHVNNSKFMELFEECRWELITNRGYGLDQIQEYKKGPVILEVNIKYKKEIVNRENIKISFQLTRLSGKIMIIQQEMIKEDGSVASIADYTIGFFDLVERRLIAPSKEWLLACGA